MLYKETTKGNPLYTEVLYRFWDLSGMYNILSSVTDTPWLCRHKSTAWLFHDQLKSLVALSYIWYTLCDTS